MSRQGLFVGLITLDIIYLTAGVPDKNQKIVASDYTVAAGGPATNAAVTFSHLGNEATLLGVVGAHPMTQLIRSDLASYGVAIKDLNPTQSAPPPVSSIIVTQATGDRAVISLNAVKSQAYSNCLSLFPPLAEGGSQGELRDIDIVMIDGHQRSAGQEIAQLAKSNNIPVVIDGGSWKPGFEELLPLVDYAICSANFYPPGCHSSEDVFSYLSNIGIPYIAITHGEKPIQYLNECDISWVEVPKISTVDTLAAGDIFHGAFCHYIRQFNFADALAAAAKVAAYSCQFFGSRRWMEIEMS